MCALTCCNHVMISAGQFVNKLKRNSTSLEYPSLSHTDPRGTRDWLSRDSTFWARRHDHGPTTHPARTRVRGFRAPHQKASAWFPCTPSGRECVGLCTPPGRYQCDLAPRHWNSAARAQSSCPAFSVLRRESGLGACVLRLRSACEVNSRAVLLPAW